MNRIDNTLIAYLIGVDRAETNSNGEIVCSYTKDSKRFVCMRLALSLIEEYEKSPLEGKILLPIIQDVRKIFNEVLESASQLFKGISIVYDKETQDVIDQLDEILLSNNK